jgi:Ras-related protein Rap-1B
MRELYMKQGQGFLLVFSICNSNSFHELTELREQIMRIKDDEDIPLVVVGNKSDMEDDRVVPRARAFQLAPSWGQKPYYETSARRRTNVDEVFLNLCTQIIRKEGAQTAAAESQVAQRRRDRPNRHDRKGRKQRNRDRCVIL